METRCDQTREKLSAWLDGELAAGARHAVAAHLKTCADCRRELGLLTALDEALGRLPAPAPPQVADRVLARLAQPRRRWWQNLALAASLVLGLTVGGSLAWDMFLLFTPAAVNGNGGEVLALEDFSDFPQGSLGAVLVAYGEEGNGS
jgi:anti-sigma factor RsiW